MTNELVAENSPRIKQDLPQHVPTSKKKVRVELRRRRPVPSVGQPWYRRILWRLKNDSQFLRTTTQAAFALLCIWIGIEYHLFVRWGLSHGSLAVAARPPGVEGFLPISALMSLKYWLDTGIINQVHPSGFFILLAIAVMSVVLKKAFCSWLCPVGTLSESLWMLGQKVFGWNLKITKWIDYPLRSIKYLLFFFFLYSIWQMDVSAMKAFIESPYNKMADAKMYLFFANISTTALWTILILAALSVFIKNFWCRYLCPYGAFLGALSIFSPLKITRQQSSCIDCELCTRACPSAINVHKLERVWSDECTACMKCVEACPVKDTLDLRIARGTNPIPTWVFGGLVVGIFVAVTGLAMLTGHWSSSISNEEYARRFQQIDSPAYQHPFSEAGSYGPNK